MAAAALPAEVGGTPGRVERVGAGAEGGGTETGTGTETEVEGGGVAAGELPRALGRGEMEGGETDGTGAAESSGDCCCGRECVRGRVAATLLLLLVGAGMAAMRGGAPTRPNPPGSCACAWA